jgi:hypothetical protein
MITARRFVVRGLVALALAASIVSYGGRVAASAPGPIPITANLYGPAAIAPGHIGAYSLYVTFSDGTSGTYEGAPATFTASTGNFTGNSYLVPPTYAGAHISLSGKYSANGYYAVGRKIISTL